MKQSTTASPTLPRWSKGSNRFDAGVILLLIVSYITVAMLPFAPKKFGDWDFHIEAKALALAIQQAGPWTDVSITKAPAPVFYYAIPYLAVPPGSEDDSYWLAAFIWTIGWMSLATLLIRRAGEYLGGALVGRLAAVLTIMLPFWIYYSYGINAEPLAYLGVAVAIYGWARWRGEGQQRTEDYTSSSLFKKAWCLPIGLSLFVLARPNALLLLPVAVLAAVFLWRTRSPERRREARLIVMSVALVSLVVVMTSVLVKLLPERPGEIQQAEYLAHTVFMGRFQFRAEPLDWRFWGKATRQNSADYATWVRELAELERQSSETGVPLSRLQWRWILGDIIRHPGTTLQMIAIRIPALHIALVNSRQPDAFKIGAVSGYIVYLAFHFIINAINLLVIGAALRFLVARRHELASLWVLWGPWLALLIFHVATYSEPRYMFPSQPGIVIMAAMALAPAYVRLKSRLAFDHERGNTTSIA